VVLRGLPASPSLSNLILKIPAQDGALSLTSNPQCAFALGRASNVFRRVFCQVYEPLFGGPGVAGEAGKGVVATAYKRAVSDLCAFMALLTRCVLWRYAPLVGAAVRDVAGDNTHGRVQDSRRGGAIPLGSSNVMLVVRTCVEDTVLDPLLDNLYLAYGAMFGEEDVRIARRCAELRELPREELMTLCGVSPFFQLEVANPPARSAQAAGGATQPPTPYAAAIELLVSAWVSARTPCAKICLLAQAHQECVEAVFKHYGRPTFERTASGSRVVRSAITDRRRLIPRKSDMIAIFTYCLVASLPPNLESQSRLIFDLGSRHAVSNSDVSAHVLALVFMCAQRVLKLQPAAVAAG